MGYGKGENKQSRKGSDETRPGKTSRTPEGRVGGKSEGSHGFEVPNHPDHSIVHGPKGKADK